MAEVVGPCPNADCAGSVTFVDVPNVTGMIGVCDRCGAEYQLVAGRITRTSPPRS